MSEIYCIGLVENTCVVNRYTGASNDGYWVEFGCSIWDRDCTNWNQHDFDSRGLHGPFKGEAEAEAWVAEYLAELAEDED